MESQNNTDYQQRIEELERITLDFFRGLHFIALSIGRSRSNWDITLWSLTLHDVLEAGGGVLALAREGASNAGKRELRFLIELAIKVCYVEQKFGNLSIADKVKAASEQLDTANIGIKNKLSLQLLDSSFQDVFRVELGRLYGTACDWVHLTVNQLKDRMERVERGITAGMEGCIELSHFIALVEQSYAAVLVLVMHSVPDWVVGDLLVNSEGDSYDWHFRASKFIANIDARFDYKAERQEILSQIQELRARVVRF